jgi:tetratricopeptide (TPR) repeat protein
MLAGQYDEALDLCRRAAETARLFNNKRYLGTYLWVSADVFRKQGNLDAGLKDIRESVRILKPTDSADQGLIHNFALALIHEGKILGEDNAISLGQSQQAAAILEQAFNIADKSVHQDADDQTARGLLAMAGIPMADLLRESEAGRSLAVYDHIFHHMGEIKDNASLRLYEVSALAGSTYPLRRLGRSDEVRQRLDAAFERLRQVKAYPAEKVEPGSESEETLCALADDQAARGDVPRAIEIYQELLGKVLASHPEPETSLEDAVGMSRLYSALAGLHRQAHHTDLASALELRRLELWRHWDAKLPHNSFVTRQMKGVVPTLSKAQYSQR